MTTQGGGATLQHNTTLVSQESDNSRGVGWGGASTTQHNTVSQVSDNLGGGGAHLKTQYNTTQKKSRNGEGGGEMELLQHTQHNKVIQVFDNSERRWSFYNTT